MSQSQVQASVSGNTQPLDAAARLLQGPVSNRGLCLLSLDGGGVRGLSTLMILRYLMAKINSGLPPEEQKKPFEVFDMIGGTSTGGLVAIMLGRLKMGVQECIDLYNSMFKEIFGSRVHKFPVTVALQIQSQFDSAILRRCITRIVGQSKNLAENDLKAIANAKNSNGSKKVKDALIEATAAKVLLDDEVPRGCHTFVCATTAEDQRTVRFRDYPRSDLGKPNNISIVDAACATSAATSYFDAVEVNGRKYRDGGFGANNPVTEVWHEAREIWIKDDYEVQLDDLLKCFVSIGTGFPKTEGMKENVKGFIDTLKNMVTQTKRSADDFMKSHRNLTKMDGSQRYFRFNVEQGLQDVGLEEWKKANIIETATEGYMESPERENLTALCANNLRLKSSTTSTDFIEEVKRYQAVVESENERELLRKSKEQENITDDEITPAKLTPKVLMKWLKPDMSYLDYHRSIRSKRILDEAGQWVLQDNNFEEWKRKMGGRFWLHGKVGSGKTILCSSIIEMLRTYVDDESNITRPVLFYYFAFNNSEQQKLDSFLITVLYQLFASLGIPGELQALYTKCRDLVPWQPTVPLPLRNDLEMTLYSIIKSLPDGAYLIMDALDEIPHGIQREDFLRLLRTFSHRVDSNLSLLATSQSEPDFNEEFRWDLGWRVLGMGSSRVDVDIGHFVQRELVTARKFASLSSTNRDKIRNYLVEHANGTFRWVDLILQTLQIPRVLRPKEIDGILCSLPKDLTEIYDKLLNRVDDSVTQEVTVALEWLSLSKRPLFIEEVLEGVIINPYTKPIFNPDKLLTVTNILNCLTGLVTIEPEIVLSEQIQVERHKFALAHSSVRDYLTAPKGYSSTDFRRFHFEQKIAHEFIARSCVEYLIHCKLASWLTNNYPLAKYSDHYWEQHAEHIPGLKSILLNRLRKLWSPILYPGPGICPMLLPYNSSETKCNYINISATPSYSSSNKHVESPNDTVDGTLYKPLDLGKNEFRLLVILHSQDWNDPVECRLQVVSLDETPSYSAVSWTWVPQPGRGYEILIDGVPFKVTGNLDYALRCLRKAQVGYLQVLWIDFICIDQKKHDEKNHQVTKMAQIFSTARKVIVLLGPEDESSNLAMRFLSKFQEIPDTTDAVRNGLMSITEDMFNALQNLFNRPWFSRLWVIQEVAFAKEIECHCGYESFPWSVLERFEKAYIKHGPELFGYASKIYDYNIIDHDLEENAVVRSILCSPKLTTIIAIRCRIKSGIPYNLLELLFMTRHQVAVDPRDKLFGLLLLTNEIEGHDLIIPDYTKSRDQVYTDFAIYWLHKSRNLDLLSFAGVPGSKNGSNSEHGLPSWVPNLANLRMISLDLGNSSPLLTEPLKGLYNATPKSSAFPEVLGGDRMLKLSGNYVGIIDTVSRALTTAPRMHVEQLLDCEEMMESPVVSARYLGQSKNKVFLRTLLADQEFHYATGSRRLNWEKKEIRIDNIQDAIASHTQTLRYTLEARAFMVSKCGYVGLCPCQAQSGDQIVLLHGGRMPYIIRPQHDRDEQVATYRLIGEAYVNGIMDGELFNQGPPEIQIIFV